MNLNESKGKTRAMGLAALEDQREKNRMTTPTPDRIAEIRRDLDSGAYNYAYLYESCRDLLAALDAALLAQEPK